MSITVNKNTTQTPVATLGRTGAQTVKWIPAPRIYVKASELAAAAPPQIRSNGVTPVGYTDLGIVEGVAKLTYTQKAEMVETGIDKVLRGAYVSQRTATVEFSLSQVDDLILEKISALVPTVISATGTPPQPTVGVTYFLGQTDLNILALLLVNQNKFDGKEWQHYNPAAYVNFNYEDSATQSLLKVTAYLPYFSVTGNANGETNLASTIFPAVPYLAP